MTIRFSRAFVAAFALAWSAPILAATYTVTKIEDSNDGVCDADCSLREAVAAAVASPDDDVIVFDPGLFGSEQTIVLSGTEIVIAGNGRLTIEGPGANLLTISGNNASRIFTNASGADTIIRNLRFTGGNGVGAANSGRAGAIYNHGGQLLLDSVVVSGNTATNGGGINNAGQGAVAASLIIHNSLISGNTSTSSGGGMQNFSTSTVVITNSAFVGNTGGSSTGGGAAQFNGFVEISNTTFSGNVAVEGSGGAISSNGSFLLLTNVTISNNLSQLNGGGLHRATSNVNAFLRNTIIANNDSTAVQSPDVTALSALSSLGNNLIGMVGTSSGWVASDLLNLNAQIGPLADNGGFTPTHALLESSPAIDAGNNAVIDIDVDQRGLPRPVGLAVDIGAFEWSKFIDPNDAIFADGFECIDEGSGCAPEGA